MSAVLRGRAPLSVLLALLASGGGFAASAQPSGRATVPAELRPYAPTNLRGYFLCLLMRPAQPRPMTPELFMRQQAYIRQQFEAGVYHLAGPIPDGGAMKGLVIVSAPTREAALAIVGADPAVQEGAYIVEIHPAMFPDLSSVRIEYPPAPH